MNDLIRQGNLLGNTKTIVGNTTSDLVLESLGKVYIKTGKNAKLLNDVFDSLDKFKKSDVELIISKILFTDNLEELAYPGDGTLIFNTKDSSLYLAYKGTYLLLLTGSDIENNNKYVKKSGDTMTGVLNIKTRNAPLVVLSKELVKNFNAEFLSGYSKDDFAIKALNEIITGEWLFDSNTHFARDVDVTGNLTVKDNSFFKKDIVLNGSIGSPEFASGYNGYGWRLDANTNMLTVDYLVVRKAMQVFELVVNRISATNGSLWVTDSGKVKEVDTINIYDYSTNKADIINNLWYCVYDSNYTVNTKLLSIGGSHLANALGIGNDLTYVNFYYIFKTSNSEILNNLLKNDKTILNKPDELSLVEGVTINFLFDNKCNTMYDIQTTPKLYIVPSNLDYIEQDSDIKEIYTFYKYFGLKQDKIQQTLSLNGLSSIFVVTMEDDVIPPFKEGDLIRCLKFLDNNIKYYDALVGTRLNDYKYVVILADSVFDIYSEIYYDESGNIHCKEEYNTTLYEKTIDKTDYINELNVTPSEYLKENLNLILAKIKPEDALVRIGNLFDKSRQNSIYLTSSEFNSPFLTTLSGVCIPDYTVNYKQPNWKIHKLLYKGIYKDVYYKPVKSSDKKDLGNLFTLDGAEYLWFDNPNLECLINTKDIKLLGNIKKVRDVLFKNPVMVRVGNLTGIANERFKDKQPYGYGLYGENVFLTGEFYLNNGQSIVEFTKDLITLATGDNTEINNSIKKLWDLILSNQTNTEDLYKKAKEDLEYILKDLFIDESDLTLLLVELKFIYGIYSNVITDLRSYSARTGVNLAIEKLLNDYNVYSNSIQNCIFTYSNSDIPKDKADQLRLDLLNFYKSYKEAVKLLEQNKQEDRDSINLIGKINTELNLVKNQVDKALDIWFENEDNKLLDAVLGPQLTDWPANLWETENEKGIHLGDLLYTLDGKAYRFSKDNSNYKWTLITDTAITKALADAKKAQDTADGKRTIFIERPTKIIDGVETVKYEVGDLWTNAIYPDYNKFPNDPLNPENRYNNEILKCIKTNLQEDTTLKSFNIGDWSRATNIFTTLEEYNNFKNVILGDLNDIKKQVDKKAIYYFQETSPTWSDADSEHVGDYWVTEKNAYKYVFLDNVYKWVEVTDNEIIKILREAQKALDTADGKRQVFVGNTLPKAPYDPGDLWVNATYKEGKYNYNNDLLVSTKTVPSKENPNPNIAHWILATRYKGIDEVNNIVNVLKEDLLKQIDKKIVTYFLPNEPNINQLDANNEGDLWYDTDATGEQTFLFRFDGTKWVPVSDPNLKKAMEDASKALSTADGKRTIFADTPNPPYQKGDIWLNATTSTYTNEMLMSLVDSDVFDETHWVLASKYTDDTEANKANSILLAIVEDNKITPQEKPLLKREWEAILEEYNTIKARYVLFSSNTALAEAYINYDSAYTALRTVINSCNLNLNETTTINGQNFITCFKNYYELKNLVTQAFDNGVIKTEIKDTLDSAGMTSFTIKNTPTGSVDVLAMWGDAIAFYTKGEELNPTSKPTMLLTDGRINGKLLDIQNQVVDGNNTFKTVINNLDNTIQLKASKENLDTLENKVTKNTSDITALSDNITILVKKEVELATQHFNLLKNTALDVDKEPFYVGNDTTATIDKINKYNTRNSMKAVFRGGGDTRFVSWETYTSKGFHSPNRPYTCTFYARTDSQSLVLKTKLLFNTEVKQVTLTRDWQKFTIQYNPKDDAWDEWVMWTNSGGTIYINSPQIEEGATATEWGPAPDDVKFYTDAKIEITEGKIDQQVKEITGIDERVTQNTSSIEQTSQTIQSQVTRIEDIDGRVTKNTTDIKQTADSISLKVSEGIAAEMGKVEIGGRNLLIGTNRGNENWTFQANDGQATLKSTVDRNINSAKFVVSKLGSSWTIITYQCKESYKMWKKGEPCVLSFDVFTSVETSVVCSIQNVNSTEGIFWTAQKKLLANQWNHVVFKASFVGEDSYYNNKKHLFFSCNKVGTYIFQNLQMEEGTVATDWTPATQDIEKANRNILYNSDFSKKSLKGYNQRGNVGLSIVDNALVAVFNSNGSAGLDIEMRLTIGEAKINTDYVFSGYVKSNTDNEFVARFGYGATENVVKTTTSYKRFEVLVRTGEQATNALYPHLKNKGTLYFKDIKLEEGVNATPWIPAPEDYLGSKKDLLATGIDIDAHSVTVTADRFKVQARDGVKALEVFKDENGTPRLQAQYINADGIKANNVDVTGTVTADKGAIGKYKIDSYGIASNYNDIKGNKGSMNLTQENIIFNEANSSGNVTAIFGSRAISEYVNVSECPVYIKSVNTLYDSPYPTVGIYLSVEGSVATYDDVTNGGNHALFIPKGDICGFRRKTRRIAAKNNPNLNANINTMDGVIIAITSDNHDVTLNLPTNAEDGQEYICIHVGTGGWMRVKAPTGSQIQHLGGGTGAEFISKVAEKVHVLYDAYNKRWYLSIM